MRERDLLLVDEFARLTPKLEKIFSNAIGVFNGDRAVEVDDLIQETGKGALINSRLPQYDHYTCKQLIFQKAYNVLYDYCHPPRKKGPTLPLTEAENKSAGHNSERDLFNRQWLESIYKRVGRRTWIICYLIYAGYKYSEIAEHFGMEVADVKMAVYRERQRLKERK